jgi:hypothetical protein
MISGRKPKNSESAPVLLRPPLSHPRLNSGLHGEKPPELWHGPSAIIFLIVHKIGIKSYCILNIFV